MIIMIIVLLQENKRMPNEGRGNSRSMGVKFALLYPCLSILLLYLLAYCFSLSLSLSPSLLLLLSTIYSLRLCRLSYGASLSLRADLSRRRRRRRRSRLKTIRPHTGKANTRAPILISRSFLHPHLKLPSNRNQGLGEQREKREKPAVRLELTDLSVGANLNAIPKTYLETTRTRMKGLERQLRIIILVFSLIA